ncbi:hypothetical protein [Streptomyces sp. NPDC086787]|uniref:hypothetical protein n=1 Tax=Streptomyces sp. NPDC086787 TaxID=3365759 RepID=UPI00382D2AA7
MSAEARQELWTALRNTAERGVAEGALELFLRTEAESATPATLLVSLLPTRGALDSPPEEFAQAVSARRGSTAEVTVVPLPAGDRVRVATTTTLDLYIHMPGGVGYLLLAFTVPLSGIKSPMGDLCEAIACSREGHDSCTDLPQSGWRGMS